MTIILLIFVRITYVLDGRLEFKRLCRDVTKPEARKCDQGGEEFALSGRGSISLVVCHFSRIYTSAWPFPSSVDQSAGTFR